MRMWMLAAGAAALAITAPALADPKGRGGQQAGQAQQGGGQAKARGGDRGSQRMTAQGGRGGNRPARVEQRGGGQARVMSAQHGGNRDRVRSGQARIERAQPRRINAETRRAARLERAPQRIERAERAPQRLERAQRRMGQAERLQSVQRVERGNRGVERAVLRGRVNERFAVADRGPDVFRVRNVDRGVVRLRDVNRNDLFARRLGYGAGGCPPGLAKKAVPCMPPGQAAKLVGQPLSAAARIAALDPLPLRLRSLYGDNDDYYYRYGGGYAYRVDRDDFLIAAMIPLFGAALIGRPLSPYSVNSFNVPPYYSAFYPDSPYDCHQYGYGYVYETDCLTGMVEDVIPTYDYGYGVGQILPASYGYYNVPYAYRSSFYDNDDYYYRYAPGAIYQVDRSTSLISAVAALLTGGLSIGQPLPLGYSAYNVPLAYRTSYFDTPDMWYRYDNGYIYAVDPRTRLVNSVAYAIV